MKMIESTVALALVGALLGSIALARPGAAARPTPVVCPNPAGGRCIGPLAPGRVYTSKAFGPRVSYSVPSRGWSNFEDWPGSYGLLAPGNTLAGVDGATSDFIGLFTSIAAARFTDLSTCAAEAVPGVPHTPAAIARWVRANEQLRVGGPWPAAVGGLRGVRIDVRVAPGAALPTCFAPDQNRSFTVALLLLGLEPSSALQGVQTGMTVRLYLLRYRGGTLAIFLQDVDAAPGTLRGSARVVERLRFASR